MHEGVDELAEDCRAGMTTTQKLRKVIKWVQRTEPTLYNIRSHGFEGKLPRNWKVLRHCEPRDFFLLSELVHLRDSCKATFNASIGEIFLPINWRILGDAEKENMFLSRRIDMREDNNIEEDLTCIGCQHCGSPLDSENECKWKKNYASFYCPKSTNHFHVVGRVYRPFMLYVWDESECLPLLVRNKAAELLFGSTRADRVYSCYRQQKHMKNPDQKYHLKGTITKASALDLLDEDTSLVAENENYLHKVVDFHLIWLIILKLLLLREKNSPLKFEVTVNTSLDNENGKFEMTSVSIPCTGTK